MLQKCVTNFLKSLFLLNSHFRHLKISAIAIYLVTHRPIIHPEKRKYPFAQLSIIPFSFIPTFRNVRSCLQKHTHPLLLHVLHRNKEEENAKTEEEIKI